MTAVVAHELPMIITEVEAVAVERLSPSFVRVELGSPDLVDFGVDTPLYDQRIKIVFPNDHGGLASFAGADASWYSAWAAQPEAERGYMRTYTIREVRGSGPDTRLVVDFVLHLDEGRSGPGSSWAASARPGDRLVITAPRRGHFYGGIEFAPGDARELLLVADETAVPAVCGILRDLEPSARGVAFLEVPVTGDVLPVSGPGGVQVVWLPRDGRGHGERQVEAVRRHVGLPPVGEPLDDTLVDPDLWETPTYSSSGEPLTVARGCQATAADVYAWIAGESKMVTTLRRALVAERGLGRAQVAFMGYWRDGVAMKS